MYGGKIQEVGTVEQIFHDPQHPYTRGLLDSLPSRDDTRHKRLRAIRGNVPAMLDLPTGCKFCTRCEQAFARCEQEEPLLHDLGDGHLARCHLREDGA
jgi:oligopeptide/dipeptide ABC transporter ATP-binding protein